MFSNFHNCFCAFNIISWRSIITSLEQQSQLWVILSYVIVISLGEQILEYWECKCPSHCIMDDWWDITLQDGVGQCVLILRCCRIIFRGRASLSHLSGPSLQSGAELQVTALCPNITVRSRIYRRRIRDIRWRHQNHHGWRLTSCWPRAASAPPPRPRRVRTAGWCPCVPATATSTILHTWPPAYPSPWWSRARPAREVPLKFITLTMVIKRWFGHCYLHIYYIISMTLYMEN